MTKKIGHIVFTPPCQPLLNIGHVLDTKEHEPIVCHSFNCGKHLSLQEQLAGKYCTQCMNKEKIDINKVIQI